MKLKSNFQHFKQNMNLIAYLFPKLRTVKDVFRKMSKNLCFRTPFVSQHAKEPQKLLKSAR